MLDSSSEQNDGDRSRLNGSLLKQSLGVLLLAVLSIVAASWLTPTQKMADTASRIDLEMAIPKSFADWKVDDQFGVAIPLPGQQETLNAIYDQIISRAYVSSSGRRIMLSIAYGSSQTRELRAHRQEVCYSAQGFKINALETVSLSFSETPIPATRMVAVMGGRKEPVTYWFTMGNEVVRSLWERQFSQFKFALSGVVPDGYLYRVSSIESDPDLAFKEQEAFSRALKDAIDSRLRRKLFGEA